MTETEFIKSMKASLAGLDSISAAGRPVRYRTEDVLPRTFELHFTDAELDGYCSFTVSVRNIHGTRTMKVVAHTYDGTSLETEQFTPGSVAEAVDTVDSMAVSLYDGTVRTRKLTDDFRKDVVEGFGAIGYTPQCCSKYLIGLGSKKSSILITVTASGKFTADFKRTHVRSNSGDPKIVRSSGTITEHTAKALVAAFGEL